MKSKVRNAVSLALFVLLLGALGAVVYLYREDMANLFALKWQEAALLLALSLAGCLFNCLYHRLLLEACGVKLRLVDWVGVVFVTNAVAYVLPMRADLMVSAAYYKRVKGLAYTKSASLAAGNVVFGTAFALMEMMLSLLLSGIFKGLWPLALWVFCAVCSVGLGVFVYLALRFSHGQSRLIRRFGLVRGVAEGFCELMENRRLLLRLLLCTVGSHAVHLVLYMQCFASMGLTVAPYEALLSNSISRLSTIVAVVPGNVGIREAVMGAAMSLLGSPFLNGFAVSLLQRVSVMVAYAVGGLGFAYPVWRKWKNGRTDA